MKKTILSALIAATALAPAMAGAQEWQGRRGNGGGDPAARQAARAERQSARAAEPQQQRPSNPDREAFRAQRQAERAAQPAGQTFDREAFRAQRQAQRAAQPAPQAPAPVQQAAPQGVQRQWNGTRSAFGQERRDDRQDFRQERREDRTNLNNGTVTRPQYRADRRDDRQDYRADRRDDRQNFRSDRRDDRQDYRRDQNRGGSWNNGGSWNRGWRNDTRYNWQSWRGQNRNAYRLPRYYAPRGYSYGYQRFGIGVTLGSILFSQNYWINDPWDYRLPPAYGPYRWVRYYNDALLVDIETGEVVDVIHDIFW